MQYLSIVSNSSNSSEMFTDCLHKTPIGPFINFEVEDIEIIKLVSILSYMVCMLHRCNSRMYAQLVFSHFYNGLWEVKFFSANVVL